MEKLRQIGVDYVQGFAIGVPVVAGFDRGVVRLKSR